MLHRIALRPARRQGSPGGLVASIAVVGLMAVASCGRGAIDPPAPRSTGSPVAVAQLTLCADPGAVTRVRVVRIPSIGQLQPLVNGVRKAFEIVVSDPARARALARAVCGLSRMPSGVFHCPADLGGGYQLLFTAAGRRLPVVGIQTGGCEMVTGTGPVRWVARTPGFWTVFEKAVGIRGIAHRP